MGLSLESMAIEMPAVYGHPNRAAFRGVLTIVDVASDKAPSGARGHRVLLTRRAAEAAIPSLMGMGLDYSPALDRHDARRKIGVITRAEIVGRLIEVGGFLYARDFPEIVAEIGRPPRPGGSVSAGPDSADRHVRATRQGLGMSYEITDALVEDIAASVWVLNRVTFTGAAVLRRDKAAYRATWIELG
ncbi:MAG: hypothetical protein ABSG07_10740 [Terriglobales bacterium]|jgi:hypothetical protein